MSRIVINYPGHDYTIDNLYGPGAQRLQFVQLPPLHETKPGILLQDLFRVCINRIEVLDREKPWFGNDDTILDLRRCIARQEARALIESVSKGKLGRIEDLRLGPNGHLDWERLR